jgi:hypothetical protein
VIVFICLKTGVYAWSDDWTWLVIVCIICVSLIDASVAGELPEEEYYQEEEDYTRHFANQGKPSFESYPIT